MLIYCIGLLYKFNFTANLFLFIVTQVIVVSLAMLAVIMTVVFTNTYCYSKIDVALTTKQRFSNTFSISLFSTLTFVKLFCLTLSVLVLIKTPFVLDSLQVMNEWNRVHDYKVVQISNFNYLNDGNYDDDYDTHLDSIERMQVVKYFDDNYQAAYISGGFLDYEIPTPSNVDDIYPFYVNDNYLKIQDFEQTTFQEPTVLIPKSLSEYNDILINSCEDYFNLANLVAYNYEDRDFYSYIAVANTEIGSNGYLTNPVMVVDDKSFLSSDLYTMPFQDFMYLDDKGDAVQKYYDAYDINENNISRISSKYSEYSTILSEQLYVLSLLLYLVISMIILYIIVLKMVIGYDFRINGRKLALLRINGFEVKSFYLKLYFKYLIVTLLLVIICIVYSLIVLPTDYKELTFVFLLFPIFETITFFISIVGTEKHELIKLIKE